MWECRSITRGELWIICRRALSSGAFRAQQAQTCWTVLLSAPRFTGDSGSFSHTLGLTNACPRGGRVSFHSNKQTTGLERKHVRLRRGFRNKNIRRWLRPQPPSFVWVVKMTNLRPFIENPLSIKKNGGLLAGRTSRHTNFTSLKSHLVPITTSSKLIDPQEQRQGGSSMAPPFFNND